MKDYKSGSINFTNFIKETLNIPFVTGIIAIILSTIPFVSKQVKDKNSFVTKYIIGI